MVRILRGYAALLMAAALFLSALPVAFAEGKIETPVVTEAPAADGIRSSDGTIGDNGNPEDNSGSLETSAPEGTSPITDDGEQQTDPSEENTDNTEETTEPATKPTTKPTAKPTTTVTEPANKPDTNGSKVDYSGLTRQVAIANGLNEKDYSQASWEIMQKALERGVSALESTKQATVDAAEKALQEAIFALVKMDYSALRSALAEVEALNDSEGLYDLWAELVPAVDAGKELLNSGDQDAVDAGAAAIYDIMTRLESSMEILGTPEVVVQEVRVEVPPADDYCNIAQHHVWPVLFFVSLAVNVALAAILVMVLRRKKIHADNTPLIDYDIDDDIYGM